MFKKLLIIGCGLIGSSILRKSIDKKISKNILIYEKSKKHKSQIKKINKKIIILNKLDNNNTDYVPVATIKDDYNFKSKI